MIISIYSYIKSLYSRIQKMAVGGHSSWCNLVVICVYFKTHRSVLLFVNPCSLPGGMRFAAVRLDR